MVSVLKQSTMTMKERYDLLDVTKIAYVDIETTNLDPDFGFMLSICAYVRDVKKNKYEMWTYVLNKKEIFTKVKNRDLTFDKRILAEFLDDIRLQKVNMIVGHYSNGFNKMDWPFIRSRAFICGLEDKLPRYGAIRFGDTWKMGHLTIKAHNYRLDSLGHIVSSKTKKTPVDEKAWQLAKFGDVESLKIVVDHNQKDVKITCNVHVSLERFNPIPGVRI